MGGTGFPHRADLAYNRYQDATEGIDISKVLGWGAKIPDLVTCFTSDLSHRRDLPPQPFIVHIVVSTQQYSYVSSVCTNRAAHQTPARCADRILTEI